MESVHAYTHYAHVYIHIYYTYAYSLYIYMESVHVYTHYVHVYRCIIFILHYFHLASYNFKSEASCLLLSRSLAALFLL